jgi:hypothetical protein
MVSQITAILTNPELTLTLKMRGNKIICTVNDASGERIRITPYLLTLYLRFITTEYSMFFNDNSLFRRILANHELDCDLNDNSSEVHAQRLRRHDADCAQDRALMSANAKAKRQEHFSLHDLLDVTNDTAKRQKEADAKALAAEQENAVILRGVAADIIVSNQALFNAVLFLADKWPSAYDAVEERLAADPLMTSDPELNLSVQVGRNAALKKVLYLASERAKIHKPYSLKTPTSEAYDHSESPILAEMKKTLPKRNKTRTE